MQKKFELALKILIGLTFFMPLAFFPSYFIFPFIVPKIVIFRTLLLLMLGVYIILLAMNWNKFKIKLTLLNIFVVLFILSFAISTFLGIDWYRSFWDNHERMLGLFTVFHYVVYYFIITSVVKEWNDWRWILRTFLFAGGIVMFIAFVQQFNQTFLMNTSGNRSAATLGNAIYVGGYGLFLVFIGWLMVMREKKIFWKCFAGLGGLLGFLGIFFSGSRGALLGLIVGIGALIIFYFFASKGNKKIRMFLGLVIIAGVAFIGILYMFRQTKFVQDIPTVGRLLTTTISSSAGTRMMSWSIALEGWRDNPIFGWGPGNYYFAFNKYYHPEFLRYGYAETWFDNAHNIVLNTLTERGLFGTVIYLGLFASAIIMLLRSYKKGKINLHTAGVGMTFLLAHLTQTVTVFENPTSYLYFFFFLAFVNAQSVVELEGETIKEIPPSEIKSPLGIIVITSAAMLLLVYVTNINVARANMATLNVIRGLYNFQDITLLYKKTVNIPTPHIDDVRNDIARTVSAGLRNYVQAGKPEMAQALFQLAYGELNKNRELHPLDVRVHAQQAILIQDAAGMSGNKSLLFEAEDIMEDALAKSPRRQQFIYTLAGIKIQLQKYDEAEALYKTAIADDEMIGESWWRLAFLYAVTGKKAEALALIDEARQRAVQFNEEGERMLTEIRKNLTGEGAGGISTN